MHCKSYSHFFSKIFQHICVSPDVNFNESLTNDVVSFEQLGPEQHLYLAYFWQPRTQSFAMHTTRTLIRLRRCAGWFVPSFDAHVRRYVSSPCSSNVTIQKIKLCQKSLGFFEWRLSNSHRFKITCNIYESTWNCWHILIEILTGTPCDMSRKVLGAVNSSTSQTMVYRNNSCHYEVHPSILVEIFHSSNKNLCKFV